MTRSGREKVREAIARGDALPCALDAYVLNAIAEAELATTGQERADWLQFAADIARTVPGAVPPIHIDPLDFLPVPDGIREAL